MADRTIDELLDAIETVQILKDTIGKHALLITEILDTLDSIEARLVALETSGAKGGP